MVNIDLIDSIIVPIKYEITIIALIINKTKYIMQISIKITSFITASTTVLNIIPASTVLSIISTKTINLIIILGIGSHTAKQLLIEIKFAIRMLDSNDVSSQNIIANLDLENVVFNPHLTQSPNTNTAINEITIINGNNGICLINNNLITSNTNKTMFIHARNVIGFVIKSNKRKTMRYVKTLVPDCIVCFVCDCIH